LSFFFFLRAEPAKTAKNIPFVSAVGAKSAENGKALELHSCNCSVLYATSE
jgi:hypothetical protein